MSYYVEGWSYGTDDCSPPESDKRWLTVRNYPCCDEIAVVVQRKRGGVYREDDASRAVANARMIADALNRETLVEALAGVGL